MDEPEHELTICLACDSPNVSRETGFQLEAVGVFDGYLCRDCATFVTDQGVEAISAQAETDAPSSPIEALAALGG